MARLADEQINQALAKLSGWSRQENEITRTFNLPGFGEAMTFVNRVAQVAEQANHHPDITISYNRVTLALTSHDSGGITERDLNLADKISELQERKAA